MDVDSEEDSESITNLFAKSLSTALNERFKYVNANDHIVFSAILDPRFKDRFLTSTSEKQNVTKRLKEWATLNVSENPDSARDTDFTRRRDEEGRFCACMISVPQLIMLSRSEFATLLLFCFFS